MFFMESGLYEENPSHMLFQVKEGEYTMGIFVSLRKKRLIALGISLAVITAGMFVFSRDIDGTKPTFSTQGATADQRIAFLKQFGWEVEAEPVEIRDITIPEEFDDVYTRYNNLQKLQEMDLQPYAGKTCRQWVYRVLNYPKSGEEVRAVLLVYQGVVIGGDISSVALDGFMTGFSGEGGNIETYQESGEAEDAVTVTETIGEDAWPTD